MRKSTLIVACIQLLLVVTTVNSYPIGSDQLEEDLFSAAFDAIRQDEGVLQQFCNPTQIDQDGTKSINTKFDPETDETSYIVDLGIIFYGTLGCNDNDDDETEAQCEVVISDDEDNTIQSVNCYVNEAAQNEGTENSDSDITTTTVASSTASPQDGDNSDSSLNEAEEQDNDDSKGPLVGGFNDATDLDPDLKNTLVNKAINAIRTNDGVNIKFCDPAEIDHIETVSITQQVVAGTNFNVILDMDFQNPSECNYDKKSVRCEVVIERNLDQIFSVSSVKCNDNDASLNHGNENLESGSTDSSSSGTGSNTDSGSQNGSGNPDEKEDHDNKQPNEAGENGPTDEELVSAAVDAIKTDAGVLENFCNPDEIEKDQDGGSLSVTSQVDEKGETNHVVELDMIFYGPTECYNDDFKATCKVVIGEDLSIKSVDCE